ncbi:MAG: flagellar protein FliT [Cycloclasticus sp.]|nr:flagellar protein FliT [Cycloclasticus sp.]
MTNDSARLQSILDDTSTLMNLAEAGEWDAVVALHKSREEEIQTLFKGTPDIDPDVLAEGIVYVLNKNKVLTQYSHSQRDSLRMEMSKAGHAHKAIGEYLTS